VFIGLVSHFIINFKMLQLFRYAVELIVLSRSPPCWMLDWVHLFLAAHPQILESDAE
jgi:hypothetical protein